MGFLHNRYSHLLRQGKYIHTFYIPLKKLARGENPSYMLYLYTTIVNSSIIIFSGYALLTGQQKIKQCNPKKCQYLCRTNWLFVDKAGQSIIFMESTHSYCQVHKTAPAWLGQLSSKRVLRLQPKQQNRNIKNLPLACYRHGVMNSLIVIAPKWKWNDKLAEIIVPWLIQSC